MSKRIPWSEKIKSALETIEANTFPANGRHYAVCTHLANQPLIRNLLIRVGVLERVDVIRKLSLERAVLVAIAGQHYNGKIKYLTARVLYQVNRARLDQVLRSIEWDKPPFKANWHQTIQILRLDPAQGRYRFLPDWISESPDSTDDYIDPDEPA